MPDKHAILSPSSAARWINCPGSVKLSEQVPPAPSSEYAEEGTAAHALAELKLRAEIGEITTRKYAAGLKKARAGQYYCGEMDEATDFYKDIVMEHLAAAGPDGELLIEQRFSLDKWAPESFGTSDAVVIGDGVLEVIDLKYGKGVRVSAKDNPQLRLYALGAADLFDNLYEFDTVRMTIIQPRLDHVSVDTVPLSDLRDWGKFFVQPAAYDAISGTGTTAPGDWCRWCPAKAICRKRADENLKLARYDFRDPDLLEPGEIGEILKQAEELQRWTADVQAYALQEALDGRHFDGWKLVEGRSVRKYADDLRVAEALQAAGFPEAALYERKLYGITAMEKIVGKKKLTEIVGDLIIKPAGKPVLVPESDKREPISSIDSAKADFS